MSDGEPSSIKRLTRCAAGVPALSRVYEDRVEARFDFTVYGLVLQRTLDFYLVIEVLVLEEGYASGSL